MDENKYVTIEMFEKYHQMLMDYIGIHDNLVLHGYAFCPKCGEVLSGFKCNKCNTDVRSYEDE